MSTQHPNPLVQLALDKLDAQTINECPPFGVLVKFHAEELDWTADSLIEKHVEKCEACSSTLRDIEWEQRQNDDPEF